MTKGWVSRKGSLTLTTAVRQFVIDAPDLTTAARPVLMTMAALGLTTATNPGPHDYDHRGAHNSSQARPSWLRPLASM